MPCQVISCWTFSTLVGAFLDLGITYFLLCGSALAYSASKFLGLVGLHLPCPCSNNGLFGNPNPNKCLQRQSVDCPFEKVSSVQLSAKTRFPFNSFWNNDDDPQSQSQSKSKSKRRILGPRGSLNSEDGGSSSCWSEPDSAGVHVKDSPRVNPGKWRFSQKLRQGLRHRKRPAPSAHHHVKEVSSSHDSLHYVAQSPDGNGITEASKFLLNPQDVGEDSNEIGFLEQVSNSLESDASLDKSREKDSPLDQFKTPLQSDVGFDGDKESMIRVLNKSLEEAHASCAALYLELEKERSAAATAADEAMAMILRLQEEKAAIDMEARQYHRMIEEKASYDAEEMNILTEILLRREKEKHFLEQEVETYRQMLFQKEQSDIDLHLHDNTTTGGLSVSSLCSSEEPLKMSEQLIERVVEKDKGEDANGFQESDTFIDLHGQTLKFGKELPIPEPNEDSSYSDLAVEKNNVYLLPSVDFYKNDAKEKGMTYMDKNPQVLEKNVQPQGKPSLSSELSAPQGLNGLDEISVPIIEEEPTDVSGLCSGFTRKMTKFFDESKNDFQHSGESRGQLAINSKSSEFDSDYSVHDIHVVSNEFDMDDNKATQNNSREMKIHHALSMPKLSASASFSGLRTELERKRNSLEKNGGLPPTGPCQRKAFGPDFRRNSMSAFDSERLKIDVEVGWLSDRLKIVQEGREKLKFTLGHKGRGKLEMQILDYIASQFRQIWQLAEPGNALEQAFSALPFTKVMTKKIRPRAVPFGVQRSI